jgi:uncharacterized membrane protein YfcA
LPVPELDLLSVPWLLALVLVIVFVAAVVQAGLGMGFGLMAAPLLAVIDPELVPAPALFLGFASSFLVALQQRHHIHWPEVGIASFGRLAGVLISSYALLFFADRNSFSVIFALMIGLAVVLSLFGPPIAFTMTRLFGVAVISGIMGTITSVGAPPLALIYQGRPAHAARATLAAFFAIGCAMSLVALFLTGWASFRDMWLAILMAPAMITGLLAGRLLQSGFDQRYRILMLTASGLAAIMLLVRGLLG